MDLLALTGNEIVLAAAALAFIVFSLIVSMVVPRYRPDFPGRGGLGIFVLAAIVFFLGTMTAVLVFGKEEEEHAETAVTDTTANQTSETETGETETGEEEEVSPEPAETEGSGTEPAAPATTSPGESAKTFEVVGKEFEYEQDIGALAPGKYTFELVNEGEVPHNLVIEGPNLDKAETPVIESGARAKVDATFEEGAYKFYCSVPGHEAAGMTFEIDVG